MIPFSFTAFVAAFLDYLRDPFAFGAFCLAMALILVTAIYRFRRAEKRAYDAAEPLARPVDDAKVFDAVKRPQSTRRAS